MSVCMTKQEAQELAVRDYRIAIEKSVEHDEQTGKYGYDPNWNSTEAEKMRERRAQLDENERAAKERYDSLDCKDLTGLGSEGFRHQVIEENSKRQMEELRERKKAEIAAKMNNTNDKTKKL